MRENKYQKKVIDRLKDTFPGCLVIKQDASYIQGIPDLLVLFHDFWFALEVKLSPDEEVQPNQDYYVNQMDDMSFAAFIYPGVEDRVFNAIQQAYETRRQACLP